jgi:hypothetical protein
LSEANEGDVLIYVIPSYKKKGEKEINPAGSLVGEAQLLSGFLQKGEFSFGRYGDTLGGRSE